MSSLVILAASIFEIKKTKKNRKTDRQTKTGGNLTHATGVVMGNEGGRLT